MMKLQRKAQTWVGVGLAMLAVACGAESTPEVVESALAVKEQGLATTDPLVNAWDSHSNYSAPVDSSGAAYLTGSADTSCWPIGAPLWRGITYVSTDSAGRRIYLGQRSMRSASCITPDWADATFTLSADGQSLTESTVTGFVWTWYRVPPELIGEWDSRSNYRARFQHSQQASLTATADASCWPLGTRLWRNVTFVGLDSSFQRLYRGQRNVRPGCQTDGWVDANFTLNMNNGSLTESTPSNGNVWTWYRR